LPISGITNTSFTSASIALLHARNELQPGQLFRHESSNRSTDMTHRRIDDWCTLNGASVEIRQQGSIICRGFVDDVTDDGRIMWVYSTVQGRRLFEKADFYQAWAVEERVGFHFKVTRASTNTAAQSSGEALSEGSEQKSSAAA
jgi:hypothetical protein